MKATNNISAMQSSSKYRKVFLLEALVAILVMALCMPLNAQLANYKLCYTQVVGLPITNPNQPPTIDGVVANDPGWHQAFRYVFNNGTPSSNAVQGIRDNSFLYMSVEVNNDATYDNADLIVLTLSPSHGASAADDRRLHIYPNNTGVQKGVGSNPRQVDYWVNSSTWNAPGVPSALPAGTVIKVSNSGAPDSGNVTWVVEIKLPLAAYNIPATGNFGLFFDIMAVNGNTSTVTENYWPNEAGNLIGAFVDTSTPAVATWGNGTQDPAATCYGVFLDPGNSTDITSNHSQTQIDAVSTPNSNIFTATPHNTSVDRNGSPIAAPGVTAKFSIANFGLGSNWTPIPTAPNPVGPQTIAASGAGSFSTTAWNITDPTLINNYKAHPDQCIRVELDSTSPGVTFVNRSVKRNMWVQTASEVVKPAQIDAKGFDAPPAGQAEQLFDLVVTKRQEVIQRNPDTVAAGRTNNQIFSRLTWIANGCRHTGRFVEIQKQKYEICEDAGAFGSIVEHTGLQAVGDWITTLEGKGVNKVGNLKNIYRISVSQDGIADLTTRFQPVEGPVKKDCFKKSAGGAMILLLGMLVVGFRVYRPRMRKDSSVVV
ncbi:MAG: hypothetical protein JWM83_1987 [Candidatus Angelobacter sp.]|nr:hypothetical protein [Candidatus Angelobacter sp.]